METKQKTNEEIFNNYCACFGDPEEMVSHYLHEDSFYVEKGINVEAFKKLLIKNDMEEYSNLLLSHFYTWLSFTEERKDQKEGLLEGSKYLRELTNALIFLLSEEEGKNLSITFQRSRGSYKIVNESIINSVMDCLKKTYVDTNSTERDLTEEEIKEEIKILKDLDWIKEWIKKQEKEYNSGDLEINELNINSFINPQMIKEYGLYHFGESDISLEFLKSTFVDIENAKNAAKETTNSKLVSSIRHLSYLKRLDKFLNQNEFSDIDKFPLLNEDCKFLHDCMTFFGIVENYSNNKINTTTPEKYIRTFLKQTKLPLWNASIEISKKIINKMKDHRVLEEINHVGTEPFDIHTEMWKLMDEQANR